MQAPSATSLATEMTRLVREQGRVRGERVLGPLWRLVLWLALGAALYSRLGPGLPGLRALHGDVWLVAILVGLLLLLPRLLRPLVGLVVRPAPARLARALDDARGWRDDTSTAWSLRGAASSPTAEPAPLLEFLHVQAAGRLREVAEARPAPTRRRLWDTLAIALIALVLLLPGVGGWLPGHGAGGGAQPVAAGELPYSGVGTPAPMPADLWLGLFVEDPPEVRPLPPAGVQPDAQR